MKFIRLADYDERKDGALRMPDGRMPCFMEVTVERGAMALRARPARRPSSTRFLAASLAEHEKEVALEMLLGARGEREGMWAVWRSFDMAKGVDVKTRRAHFYVTITDDDRLSWLPACGARTPSLYNEPSLVPVHDAGTRKHVCGYCAVIVQREKA